MTDGSHDNSTLFHAANIGIFRWESNKSLNHGASKFLQIHGKAENSCANDTVFLSAGVPAPSPAYNDGMPIRKLQAALQKAAAGHQWKIATTVIFRMPKSDAISGPQNHFQL